MPQTSFDDLESLDVDLDKVLWSDEPEQAYLNQIAGIDTTEELSERHSVNNNNSTSSFTAKFFPESLPPSPLSGKMNANAPPNVINQEAYDEDDISTIANDTVMHRFQVSENLQHQQQYQQHQQQTKKEQYRHLDPEQPGKDLDQQKQHQQQKKKPTPLPQGSGWTSRNYTCACFMAFFLMCVIAALGYTFQRLHVQKSPFRSSSSSSEPNVFEENWTFRPTPFSPTEPSPSPTTFSPTRRPTNLPTQTPTTLQPTRSPTSPPTRSPTALPTLPPTNPPTVLVTMSQQEDLKQILAQVTFNTLEAIQVNGSPQQRAFSWLHQDPRYSLYGERRIVQRFALGTLYYAVTTSFSSQTSQKSNEALQTWMDYGTNECTWFTSWYNNRLPCDADGVVKFLALINIELSGTIPSELALLTKLNSLLLHNNKMSGNIPREFGEWTSLEVLDLHSNLLTGRIPEWNNIPRLAQLNLSSNQLTGSIPANTANLSLLTNMDLSDNNLVGTMPNGVCDDSFLVLAADCDQVYCDCCTNCQSQGNRPTPDPTPIPSPAPTPDPTPSPVSEPDPTQEPTPSPGSEPSCTTQIQGARSCFEEGVGIRVTFTNCDPLGNDWVGLYDADEDSPLRPFLWDWTCGTQECFGAVPEGSLHLGASSEGTRNWPMGRGDYKLWLLRRGESGGPYPILAESETFTISNSC